MFIPMMVKGPHAVTIVGYGVLDNKIYWLVQNSWVKICMMED